MALARKFFPNPTTAARALRVTRDIVEIAGHRTLFRLKRAVDLHACQDGARFILEYAPLGIEVYGSDQDEALEAFAEAFEDAWEWLTESPSDGLTGDAVLLKKAFERLVLAAEPMK